MTRASGRRPTAPRAEPLATCLPPGRNESAVWPTGCWAPGKPSKGRVHDSWQHDTQAALKPITLKGALSQL